MENYFDVEFPIISPPQFHRNGGGVRWTFVAVKRVSVDTQPRRQRIQRHVVL